MLGFIKKLKKDSVFDLSAQIAYYNMLSLVPFLVIAISSVGYFSIDSEEINKLIMSYLPEESRKIVEQNTSFIFERTHTGLISINLLLVLFATSNSVHGAVRAIHKAYEEKESRHFIKTRLLSMLFVIIMLLSMIIMILLPVLGEFLGKYFFSWFGLSEFFLTLWNLARFLIGFLILSNLLLVFYIFAPTKKVSVKQAWKGAVIASAGWILSSSIFSFALDFIPSTTVAHGSLASVLFLLIWFYFIGFFLLLGGEINAYFAKNKL